MRTQVLRKKFPGVWKSSYLFQISSHPRTPNSNGPPLTEYFFNSWIIVMVLGYLINLRFLRIYFFQLKSPVPVESLKFVHILTTNWLTNWGVSRRKWYSKRWNSASCYIKFYDHKQVIFRWTWNGIEKHSNVGLSTRSYSGTCWLRVFRCELFWVGPNHQKRSKRRKQSGKDFLMHSSSPILEINFARSPATSSVTMNRAFCMYCKFATLVCLRDFFAQFRNHICVGRYF